MESPLPSQQSGSDGTKSRQWLEARPFPASCKEVLLNPRVSRRGTGQGAWVLIPLYLRVHGRHSCELHTEHALVTVHPAHARQRYLWEEEVGWAQADPPPCIRPPSQAVAVALIIATSRPGEEPGLREQQGTLSLSPFPVDERKTLGGGMDPPKTGYVHRVNINRKSQRHKNSILRGNLEAQDLFISW